MLTLDLVPGCGLGQFALGMAVGDVLELAAQNAEVFSRVEAKVSDDHGADILLCLPAHGVNLRFAACSQTLRLIEVHDPSRLQLRYKGEVVGGSSPVTLQRVSALFGPTFPGEACGDRLLALHYRGLVFLFAQNAAEPDVSAARIVICAPAVHAGTQVRLDAVLAAAPPVTSPPVAPLVAVMGFGLRLAGGATLPFGVSLQDLVAELGPPSSSWVKGSDAMLIHASAQTPGPSGEPYFLTWQHRGLDVLIDGEVRCFRHASVCWRNLLTCPHADAPLRQVCVPHKRAVSHELWRVRESRVCAGDARRRATRRGRPLAGRAVCVGTQRAAGCQHRRSKRRRRPRRRCAPCCVWPHLRVRLRRRRVRGHAKRQARERHTVRARIAPMATSCGGRWTAYSDGCTTDSRTTLQCLLYTHASPSHYAACRRPGLHVSLRVFVAPGASGACILRQSDRVRPV